MNKKTRVLITNQQVESINKRLEKWMTDRRITQQHQYSILTELLQEELDELIKGGENNNITEIVDAITDLVVVFANGTGGIKIFEEDMMYDDLDIDYENIKDIVSYCVEDTKHILNNYKKEGADISYYPYFMFDALMDLGYEPYLCMDETIKHIESRRQNPEQEKQWLELQEKINNYVLENGYNSVEIEKMKEGFGKWDKMKNQKDVYVPDFNKCKVVR